MYFDGTFYATGWNQTFVKGERWFISFWFKKFVSVNSVGIQAMVESENVFSIKYMHKENDENNPSSVTTIMLTHTISNQAISITIPNHQNVWNLLTAYIDSYENTLRLNIQGIQAPTDIFKKEIDFDNKTHRLFIGGNRQGHYFVGTFRELALTKGSYEELVYAATRRM